MPSITLISGVSVACHPKSVSTEIEQRADFKLSGRRLVDVAREISGYWKDFAALLAPNKFTSSTVSVIEQQNRFSLFGQAHRMLDDWTDDLDRGATCRLIIETFVRMDKNAQANSIFGPDLVDYCVDPQVLIRHSAIVRCQNILCEFAASQDGVRSASCDQVNVVPYPPL